MSRVQSAWERERREKGNTLTILLATWVKIHKQGEGKSERGERAQPSGGGDDAGDTTRNSSSQEYRDVEENSAESAGMDLGSSDGEDIVEDFRLSTDESD